MHSCLPASWTTPATLALMTAVGPPDCATKRLPTNSGILLSKLKGKRANRAHRCQSDLPKRPVCACQKSGCEFPQDPRYKRFDIPLTSRRPGQPGDMTKPTT